MGAEELQSTGLRTNGPISRSSASQRNHGILERREKYGSLNFAETESDRYRCRIVCACVCVRARAFVCVRVYERARISSGPVG